MSIPENIQRRPTPSDAGDAYAPERDAAPPQPRPIRGLPDYPVRLLSYADLHAAGISYSRVHLNRLIDAGKFPAPLQLGPSRIAWLESEIVAWIRARADARTAPEPTSRDPGALPAEADVDPAGSRKRAETDADRREEAPQPQRRRLLRS